MPIMEFNEKLTRIIRGRSIGLVLQEEGLVTIVFDIFRIAKVRDRKFVTCIESVRYEFRRRLAQEVI
jgi:hypothetical protein